MHWWRSAIFECPSSLARGFVGKRVLLLKFIRLIGSKEVSYCLNSALHIPEMLGNVVLMQTYVYFGDRCE